MAERKKKPRAKAKKVTKKKTTKKKATKKKAVKEFDLSDIESELSSFGATMFDESEPDEALDLNAIPFKFKALQKITGGVFQGKFFEIGASSQAGKSFNLYQLMGSAIEMGGYALLLDGERALEESYAQMMGLNIRSKRFMLAEKRTKTQRKLGLRGEPIVSVEMFFKLAYAFCKNIREHDKDRSKPIIIGIDSYPLLKTDDDLEKLEKGKDPMGYASMQRAAKFNTATTTYIPKFDQLGATLVCLNQLTKRYDVQFGDPWESNGENKIKYNATQRLKGKLVGKIKDKKTKEQIGQKVQWSCIKNRGVKPFQTVTIKYYYNRPIDTLSGFDELLIADGSIRSATKKIDGKTVKGYKLNGGEDTEKFYSLDEFDKLVEENPHVEEPIWTKEIEPDLDIEEEIDEVKEYTQEAES
jgi:RecA/RadA recombinase